jgi:hypothetical protein
MAFEQERLFIVSHLLWQRASSFSGLIQKNLYLTASYNMQGDVENLFEQGFSQGTIESPHMIRKGMLKTF